MPPSANGPVNVTVFRVVRIVITSIELASRNARSDRRLPDLGKEPLHQSNGSRPGKCQHAEKDCQEHSYRVGPTLVVAEFDQHRAGIERLDDRATTSRTTGLPFLSFASWAIRAS
jgi:hypothetical protein